MDHIRENDVVALLVDQPVEGLHRGDIGTVVHVFDATADHPSGFVVEFADESAPYNREHLSQSSTGRGMIASAAGMNASLFRMFLSALTPSRGSPW